MPDMKSKPIGALKALKEELSKGFISKDFTVSGHVFKIKTLNEDDETWADTYVRNASAMSLISSRKTPRLAAAIMSVDGTPIDQLFDYPDDMDEKVKKELESNKLQRKYWLYNQMFLFLNEDGNRTFVNELYKNYEKLEEEAAEGTKLVSN